MGFSVAQSFDQGTGQHVVSVRVALSMAETNALFLSGDAIVSWPEGELRGAGNGPDGAAYQGDERTPARTGMFISELARLAQGLEIGYRHAAEAERAAQLLRLQLLRARIEEVG